MHQTLQIEDTIPSMNFRRRLEVRRVAGLFRVIARTAAFVPDEHGHLVRSPEPVEEYVHKRTFADNGEAWKLALKVEHAIKSDEALNLRLWDLVAPGDLPADSLLPRAYQRVQESPTS